MDYKVPLLIVAFIFFIILIQTPVKSLPITHDIPTHSSPKHLLYNVLQKYSNGDKITLTGNCNVNLYTKYIITSEMKQYFKKLINEVLLSIYNVTQNVYQIQELNNIYEEIDYKGNKRYIIDATINATHNFYTVKLLLDIVTLNGDTYINYINVNTASNNNILDKYHVKYKGTQGILSYYNNFSKNIKTLLDSEYKKHNKLIGVSDSSLNYNLNNVLSLSSLVNMYFPSTLSENTLQGYESNHMKGLVERYLPTELTSLYSKYFCDKDSTTWNNRGINNKGSDTCLLDNTNVYKEIIQPKELPGLFFDRSSRRKY